MKKAAQRAAFFLGTEGRDRTGTSVTSSVFETDASTDSATSACFGVRVVPLRNAAAKIQKKSFTASLLRKNSIF